MMNDILEEIILMCVNQFVRPKYSSILEGYGDCTKCVPDKKNEICKGYYPISVYVIDNYEGYNDLHN